VAENLATWGIPFDGTWSPGWVSPAQVMLRWGLQHGRSVIPKSTKPSRIAENINVFDIELSADEMTVIDVPARLSVTTGSHDLLPAD
jgi:diketogulonate reductase-like aldo/keto reductase